MPNTTKLLPAVEEYFDDLRKIRASGVGTAETSYYPPLTNLLNAMGRSLKPKVFCISQLSQQARGPPRFRHLRRQTSIQGPAQAGAAPGRRCRRGQTRE